MRSDGTGWSDGSGGLLTALPFAGGFAPVPQDTNFDDWGNAGWPRGPVPLSPASTLGVADLNQHVMMWTGAKVNETAKLLWYDNPVDLNNGGVTPAGAKVQIRLAAGPGAWQGVGGAVVTTYGRWSVNADGLHLSYRPKPRATGPGANDIDTEAEYRWAPDGATWSTAGTLKMTLEKPLSTVFYAEDYLTPNNLGNDNHPEWGTLMTAAKAVGGTVTQRSWANVFTCLGEYDFDPAAHFYGLNLTKYSPSPGFDERFIEINSWTDTPHDPIDMRFIVFNGRSGDRLKSGSTTELWDNSTGLEQDQFIQIGRGDENGPFHTNRIGLNAKYCMFVNHVSESLSQWHNSDLQASHITSIGCWRGIWASRGYNTITRLNNFMCLNLPTNEQGNWVRNQLRYEPEQGNNYSQKTADILLEDGFFDQQIRLVSQHYLNDTPLRTLVVRNLVQNPNWGGVSNVFGPGCKVFDCDLSATTSSAFMNDGYPSPHGDREFTNTRITISNNPHVSDGALILVLSTDHLRIGMDWRDASDGFKEIFTDCEIVLAEGLQGHSGLIRGIRLNNSHSTLTLPNVIRLIRTRFVEAQDGAQFEWAISGRSDRPSLIVEHNAETLALNQALIAAGRFWGPDTVPTLIG